MKKINKFFFMIIMLVLKDLVEHAKVQKQDVLEELLDYLASSISSLTNYWDY